MTTGSTTSCDTASPNPYTGRVGSGRTDNGRTVTVGAGSTIDTFNNNAISLGDTATITINGTVTNVANNGGGSGTAGTGNNTVEFQSNGTLIISETGKIIATGTSGNSEAINPTGFGNSIVNRGLIQATNSNAIWFEDQFTGTKNVIDNYGTIERVGGGSVMGSTRGAGIAFYNRTGARIIGSLSFGGGDDDLVFEAGSSVTGSINGGGGTNNLTLQGAAGNDDVLSGNISNFTTLTKDGQGRWTLPGSLSGFTIVTVNNGTLALTGNNSNYTGNLIINPDGTLEARAQSLPTKIPASSNNNNVQNDGLLRFVQSDDGTYVGQITGTGVVEKRGGGVLTLNPSVGAGNSFSGGLLLNEGTVAVGVDNALGAASGGLTFNGGALRLTNSFDIDAGRAITLEAGGGTIDTASGVVSTISQAITGNGALTKAGDGTLTLTAANAFTGGTSISGGTLQLGDGGTSGSVPGDIVNDGILAFNRSDQVIFGDVISGSGRVDQNGTGTTIFTGDNSYTGGTTINAGVLQLGNGGTSGSITGDIVNDASLIVDRSDAYILDGEISGTGTFDQNGTGTTVLTGDNSYAGATTVNAGSLIVNGDQSAATGLATVLTGATLGGMGTVGGDVVVQTGGTINPGDIGSAPGVLGIGGNLDLAAGSILDFNLGQANVPGGALNDLINVGGDLVLGGTLNVQTSAGGSFDPGIYRVINYGGALTNNGLTLGTIPSPDFYVQTSVPGQVNLVNTQGLTLRYWDGATIPSKNNGLIEGGDGLWQNFSGNDNWTEPTGAINAPFTDAAFAIFMGAPGNVTVDESLGAVNASGMQFLTDGYVIAGDRINLAGAPSSVIRVGDGTAAGAGTTATIQSELAGGSQLVKSDLGTLILSGANSYSGGTAINGGTLQVAGDANLGAAPGALSFDGGTLNTTADMTSARSVQMTGNGTLLTDANTTLTLGGAISGAGDLTKAGAGTLVLTGASSHGGTTHVETGRLFVNGDQSGASGAMEVASGATLGGTGTIGGTVLIADGAILAPGMDGVGTLAINGNLALASGSVLNYEFGQANVPGGALNDLVNVGGDLALDGTINVTVPAGGGFGPGVYRVFNYGGALTDNGLALGTLPAGADVFVQTAVAGQVNLVNRQGLTLSFWDGAAGPKNNAQVNGGDGVWRAAGGTNNWTEASGAVNADYAQDSFAIFSAAPGTVTVDNGDGAVRAIGMQFASDGYLIQGGPVTLSAPRSIVQVGDSSAAGAGYTVRIAAELTGAAQLVKTDAGRLILSGANSYSGGTAINGGTLQVAGDANLGAAPGALSFDGGTLNTTADMTSARSVQMTGNGTLLTDANTTLTLGGAISGAGDLTKAGAGTLVLTQNSGGYGGAARVDAGTLVANGVLGGSLTVAQNGRLEGIGQVGSTTNIGTIAPGYGGQMGTLTVQGDYAGNGGRLEIATTLGDDSSPASRLVVNGSTAGTTQVQVTNRGGLGAQTQEGIKIVEVAGASDGRFVLDGDYLFEGSPAIIAGAYGYRLYQGGVATPGDGDWYLRSALTDGGGTPPDPEEPEPPLFQPGVPVYEAYGANLLSLNSLPTLQQRVGNRSWAAGVHPEGGGIWGRMEGMRDRANARISTSFTDQNINSWKMQIGADQVLAGSDKGERLVLGVTGHYGKANSHVRSVFGNGSIRSDGYGLGTTLTWYGLKGFYVDAQAQFSWYDSDLRSDILGNLVRKNDGTGESFSVEAGKRTALGGNLSITPQTQMIYSNVRFDRFTDPAGALVSRSRSDSLRSRWGVSLDRQSEWEGGRSHVYGIVNLNYEWLDGTRTMVSGTPLDYAKDRLWGELGLGTSIAWRGGVTLYGEVSGTSAFRNFGDSYTLKADAGVRLSF